MKTIMQFLDKLYFRWKKTRKDFNIFEAAELQIIQSDWSFSYQGIIKNFDINIQSRASLIVDLSRVLISTNHNQASLVLEVSKILLATNQNWALFIKGFSKVLISTNQNQALLVMELPNILVSTKWTHCSLIWK